MEKVIYICDNCKRETTNVKVVRTVTVTISNTSPGGYGTNAKATRHICIDCLTKIGIDPTQARSIESNNATLEDRFVDLLSDLGVRFED